MRRIPTFPTRCYGGQYHFSGFARRINAWVNGHNRRCLSLRGNENPFEFDPLYSPATRGLHYGQELGSTNRPDTFEQTKPPATTILLAIMRRTIHSHRVGGGCQSGSKSKPKGPSPLRLTFAPFRLILRLEKTGQGPTRRVPYPPASRPISTVNEQCHTCCWLEGESPLPWSCPQARCPSTNCGTP